MGRRVWALSAIVAIGGFACTPNVEQAPIQAPLPVATVAPTATQVAPPAAPDAPGRTPSRELVRRWPMKDDAIMTMYIDFAGFTSTEAGREIGKQMAAAFKSDAPSKCFASVLGLKEVAFGVDDEGGIILGRLDKDPTPGVKACLDAVDDNWTTTTVRGATSAWTRRSEVFVVEGNFAIFGTQAIVERSLRSNAPDEGPLASIHLAPDQYLAWFGHEREVEFHGSMRANAERLVADGELTFKDVTEAERAERNASPARIARELGRAVERFDKSQWPLVNRLAHDVTMRREDGKITVVFELPGTPKEQAADLGALGALGVRATEKMLAQSRVDEARDTLYNLQGQIRQWWAKGANKKKLVSLPAVPKTVPKGAKVTTTDADWKGWSTIGFKREEPQRYQYEVRASKSGDSLELLARGDLDGNGKQSLFKLTMTLDPSTNDFGYDTHIDETDPFE